MKKFIRFLFLLVLLVVALFALLLRNDFDKITESREALLSTLRTRVDEIVYVHAPRPIRIFLFENMPGLFPVAYVCEGRAEGAAAQSFFPGDLISAPDKDIPLFCPGDLSGVVQRGGELRLLPGGEGPEFFLVKGHLKLRLPKGKVALQTDFYKLSLTGEAATNVLKFGASPDGYSIGCLSGAASGQLANTPQAEGKKNFLVTRDCLWHLKWSENQPDLHLMPGDSVAYEDIEKNREQWAPQDLSSRLFDLGLDPAQHPAIIAKIDPVPSSSDTVKLSWQSSAPAGLYECTLYTQEHERGAAQPAHRFQGQAAAGELVLLKGFLKFWISLSCNDGKSEASFTSNLLAPLN